MTKLDVAFNFLILENEGSKYVNDPDDSGGPTKWGSTKATYEAFFRRRVADLEIEQMTAATAKLIYSAEYWARLSCEKVYDVAFGIALFDCGVLYGVGSTAYLFQRALRLRGADIKLDGVFGDKSSAALNRFGGGTPEARKEMMQIIHGLLLDRIDAVIAVSPKDEKYRKGWTLRADRLLLLLKDDYLNKFAEEIFT